ncbi:MAG TPA: hypothetical protein VGK32_11595 [Vicinamibacterales bacterium]|jgi:hypothetical protein
MMRFWRSFVPGVLGYVAASLAFTWPLPLYLRSRLPGATDGDIGLYVWNLWVFRHELARGHSPLVTSAVFSLESPTDLSLHNYTIFADLLAAPILPILGVVATFNVLYLALLVLNATMMFLLARRVTGSTACAWLAGLLFGFSPTLVARSTAHASLVAAAPLPLFVLCLLNMESTGRRRWAVAGGATLAWATICDPYYGVYCLVIAGFHLTVRMLAVHVGDWQRPRGGFGRALEVVMGVLALLLASILLTGGFVVTVGAVRIGLETTYTPVLALTCACLAWMWMAVRPRFAWRESLHWMPLVRLAPYGLVTAIGLLAPLLHALLLRVLDGRYVTPTVFWRSSTPGVDVLSFFAPNPNNAWLGPMTADWLSRQQGGMVENTASVTIVALLTMALAVRFAGFRPPARWCGLALLAISLTLGPFVTVAGFNTSIPTPWALLRYVPLIGGARVPARFAVLVVLAVAVIFGLALHALLERYPRRRLQIVAAIGTLLVIELCPAPRPLASAEIPSIYDTIARGPRPMRVLELPFGVRDGLGSVGSFSTSSQFFQTHHGKAIIGGYLSRVSTKRVGEIRRRPVLNALIALSEGRVLEPDAAARLEPIGRRFIRRARIGYVIVNRERASPALIDFAVRVLNLQKVGQAANRDLYRTPLDTLAEGAAGGGADLLRE